MLNSSLLSFLPLPYILDNPTAMTAIIEDIKIYTTTDFDGV